MQRALPVSIVLLALACGTPRPERPDPASVRASLDSLWTRYSAFAVAGDAEAIAQLYADSAYVAELGLPTMRGRSGVREVAKEVLGSLRILESSIRPELTDITGDRVVQFGTYRDVLQSAGQPAQVAAGRFAAVVDRDSAGAWRVSRLIAFPDSTVPQTPVPSNRPRGR